MHRRKALAAVGLASVALATAAHAQSTGGNQYDVSGGTSTRGGTAKKPKAAGLSFSFSLTDPAGAVPTVVKTYEIKVEGGKVNSSLIPGCKGADMDRAQSDAKCPKGSQIGSGTLTALIGKTGEPAAQALNCTIPFKIYNSGGGKAALWIVARQPACPVALSQSVPASWTKSGTTAGLKFTVPDLLRHQLGLDIPVVGAKATIKKVTKKGKGFLESTGCKDGKRDFSVTFTTEDGQKQTVEKTLNYC